MVDDSNTYRLGREKDIVLDELDAYQDDVVERMNKVLADPDVEAAGKLRAAAGPGPSQAPKG